MKLSSGLFFAGLRLPVMGLALSWAQLLGLRGGGVQGVRFRVWGESGLGLAVYWSRASKTP